MAKNKQRDAKAETLLFDVLYEDGTRTSNRRVNSSEIGPFDKEESIRAVIEAQDKKIGEASGMPRGKIKAIAAVK